MTTNAIADKDAEIVRLKAVEEKANKLGNYPKVEYRVCSRCCNIEQLDEIAVKHWI